MIKPTRKPLLKTNYITMSNLKNGDLIMIRYNGEEAKAKFLKKNADETKLNVFAKGKLLWVPATDFISMAEPLSIVKNDGGDDKVVAEKSAKDPKKDSRESKKTKETKIAAPKEAEQGQETPSGVEAGENTGGGESSSNEKEISLTKHQATVLDFLITKGEGGSEDPLTISEETGLLVPQINKAADGLAKAGLITRDESKETGIKLILTQKGFTMSTKKKSTKNRAAVKKMKPAAKGEASLSKRDQVIALLKDKALTINDIAEKLDTDPNYVREIKTSISKKIEEPETNTTKGKIWKMLKDGKTAKEVADKVGKSSVYVYKIQKQMVSSGHL